MWRLEIDGNFLAVADVADVAHELDFVGFVKCAYMTTSLSRSFEGAVRLREAAIWEGATDAETGPGTRRVHSSSGQQCATRQQDHQNDVSFQTIGRLQGQSEDGSAWLEASSDMDCGCAFAPAPVCRVQSIRMVLAAAAEFDWEIYQLDVQAAFLLQMPNRRSTVC